MPRPAHHMALNIRMYCTHQSRAACMRAACMPWHCTQSCRCQQPALPVSNCLVLMFRSPSDVVSSPGHVLHPASTRLAHNYPQRAMQSATGGPLHPSARLKAVMVAGHGLRTNRSKATSFSSSSDPAYAGPHQPIAKPQSCRCLPYRTLCHRDASPSHSAHYMHTVQPDAGPGGHPGCLSKVLCLRSTTRLSACPNRHPQLIVYVAL